MFIYLNRKLSTILLNGLNMNIFLLNLNKNILTFSDIYYFGILLKNKSKDNKFNLLTIYFYLNIFKTTHTAMYYFICLISKSNCKSIIILFDCFIIFNTNRNLISKVNECVSGLSPPSAPIPLLSQNNFHLHSLKFS